MKKLNVSAHTRGLLLRLGYIPKKVQWWNTHARRSDGAPGKRMDLWGIADWVAIAPGLPVLFVQDCAASGVSSHVDKCSAATVRVDGAEVRVLPVLLSTGARFEVMGWARQPDSPRVVVRRVVAELRAGALHWFDCGRSTAREVAASASRQS